MRYRFFFFLTLVSCLRRWGTVLSPDDNPGDCCGNDCNQCYVGPSTNCWVGSVGDARDTFLAERDELSQALVNLHKCLFTPGDALIPIELI